MEKARRDFVHKEKVRLCGREIEILSRKASIRRLVRLGKEISNILERFGPHFDQYAKGSIVDKIRLWEGHASFYLRTANCFLCPTLINTHLSIDYGYYV